MPGAVRVYLPSASGCGVSLGPGKAAAEATAARSANEYFILPKVLKLTRCAVMIQNGNLFF